MTSLSGVQFGIEMRDYTVYLDLECQYVEHTESERYDNLYIAPRLSVGEEGWSPQLSSAKHSAVCQISDGLSQITLDGEDLAKGTAVGDFLYQACNVNTGGIVVFQVPKADGYVAYSDPWVSRVADCELVISTKSFVSACDGIKGFRPSPLSIQTLAKALVAAVGAATFSLSMTEASIDKIEDELGRRLSFAWLSPVRVQSRRVCFLYKGVLSVAATMSRWETAKALGIKIVMMSTGDWWADNNGPYAHLRDGFISIDMQPGPGLTRSIIKGIRSYPEPIDGIFTISDGLLVSVAEAALELGLWTSGPEPYNIATNKHLTRCMANPEALDCFVVESVNALESRLKSSSQVEFPVVCKPIHGKGSEGVYRADNVQQLSEAVAHGLNSQNGGILVEPYVSGPEVDCNLVLLDGRILYFDVVDDFPSPADTAPDATGQLFSETEAVVPSRLPKREQDAIVHEVHRAVMQQGFRTGIFHCEARVMNSAMEFAYSKGAILPELQSIGRSEFETQPRIFLHEVNARIPGMASTYSSLLAQGVDFWALQMLCALADWPRYQALATSLLPGDHLEHIWLTNAIAEVTLKGLRPAYPDIPAADLDHTMISESSNPMKELSKTHGHLTKHILFHAGFVKDGIKYGREPGEWLWCACMVIRSTISRNHAHDVAQEIQIAYSDIVRERYYVL